MTGKLQCACKEEPKNHPKWPFLCPAECMRPGGWMSEVTWSFSLFSHTNTPTSSSLFFYCLRTAGNPLRLDTVAASSCALHFHCHHVSEPAVTSLCFYFYAHFLEPPSESFDITSSRGGVKQLSFLFQVILI